MVWHSGSSACAHVCFCIQFHPPPSYFIVLSFFLGPTPSVLCLISSHLRPYLIALSPLSSKNSPPPLDSSSLALPLCASYIIRFSLFFFVSELMIFPDSLRWPFVSLGGNRVHRALLHSQFGSSLSRLVFTTGLREAASGHAVYLPPGHRWPCADIVIYS